MSECQNVKMSNCQNVNQIVRISNVMYYQSVQINLAHRLCTDFQYFLSLGKSPFFYFFCFIQKMCPRLLPGPFCMDRHEFMVMRVNAVEIYEGGVTIVAIVCGNSDNREMVDPIQRSAPSLTVDRQKQRCEHLSFHFGCNSSS